MSLIYRQQIRFPSSASSDYSNPPDLTSRQNSWPKNHLIMDSDVAVIQNGNPHTQDQDQSQNEKANTPRKVSRTMRRRNNTTDEFDLRGVGTKVEEGHSNYMMAYNMLTGIRTSVSLCNAKMDRTLIDSDYVISHKYSFDVTGSQMTPGAKYDFKFKDYAPWIFRHLRAQFGIDPADYLMSLTHKYILRELGSPGKSGSFFYFSRDYKYIIKTIKHSEAKALRGMLKQYHRHIMDQDNTLLPQFYGLHRVKMPFGKKIHFVVMNNLFPPHRDIHATFDLKGSSIGREYDEAKASANPRAVLKDLNWINRGTTLELGPQKSDAFLAQLHRDVTFLMQLGTMDYSLLVGIHDLERGNKDNLLQKELRVVSPGSDGTDTMSSASREEMQRSLRSITPVPITVDDTIMQHDGTDDGIRGTDSEDRPRNNVYYIGIIDCLTTYGWLKKAENFVKGLNNPEDKISPIPPVAYGTRFEDFISSITKAPKRRPRKGKPNARGFPDYAMPSVEEANGHQ